MTERETKTMIKTYRTLIHSLINNALENNHHDMAAAFETIQDAIDMEDILSETIFALIIGKTTLPVVLRELAEEYLATIDAADLDDANIIADKQENVGNPDAEDVRNLVDLSAALFDAADTIANF
jgi:hypothetical protein